MSTFVSYYQVPPPPPPPPHDIATFSNLHNLVDIGEVTLHRSGSNTSQKIVGEINFTLSCSAYVMSPLPDNVPTPSFEWFFGPDNSSLPSGVTVSNVTNNSNTYTSTLQFSPLQESYSGLYTCRFGGNKRLTVNSNVNITMKGAIQNNAGHCTCTFTTYYVFSQAITVSINESMTPLLGQDGYKLMCDVLAIDFVIINYQWTKVNGTLTHINLTDTPDLSFSSLKLSDAGEYACRVNVSSSSLNTTYTFMNFYSLYIQSELYHTKILMNLMFIMHAVPTIDVTLVSDPTGPITEGTSVNLTCTVELGALVESDLQLFNLEVTLSRDDSKISETVILNGTTLNYTHKIVAFSRNDSGNYSCTAIATPHPSSVFINASHILSDVVRVTTGKGKNKMIELCLLIEFYRCIPEVKWQNLQQ